jgi:hypothetical protein
VRSSGVLVLLLTLACGRVGFDDLAHDASGPASEDGAVRLGPCGARASAPDPLVVTGTTIVFPSFETTQGVGDITVSAYDATTAAALDTTTSDGSGNYTLTIHGGISRALHVELANAAYLTTEQFTGDWLDADLANYQSPLWNDGALGAVYSAAGQTRDYGSGSLDVQVMTCSGVPIAGATVALDPPAGALEYLNSGAVPDPSATATAATNGAAVGFNVPVGTNTVTAAAQGASFDPFLVAVGSGESTNVIIMYAHD